MKFNEFNYRLKKDKKFLALFICSCVVAFYDLIMIVFDIVEFQIIKNNPANLSMGFLALNIIMIIANIFIIVWLIVSPFANRTKSKKNKDDWR